VAVALWIFAFMKAIPQILEQVEVRTNDMVPVLLKHVEVKVAETGEEFHKSLAKIRKDLGKVQIWSEEMTRHIQHDTFLSHFGDDY